MSLFALFLNRISFSGGEIASGVLHRVDEKV
jgi:hypothetical protein